MEWSGVGVFVVQEREEEERRRKKNKKNSPLFPSLEFPLFQSSAFPPKQELIALHVMMEESDEEEDSENDSDGEGGGEEERKALRRRKKRPAPNAAAGRGAPARAALATLASSLGARVLKRDKHSLNLITNNAAHQGVVLECGPLEWERTGSLLEAEEERKVGRGRGRGRGGGGGGGGGGGEKEEAATTTTLLSSFSSAAVSASSSSPPPDPTKRSSIPVWLVLDQVADPQNLGAILRSALFLGASGVLLSPKNCAPASAATSKASAGALEWLPVWAASRPLPSLLREAAREGNWAVLGADAGKGGAKSARVTARELLLSSSSPPGCLREEGEEKGSEKSSSSSPPRPPPPAGIALVLGSEGAGLRPVVAAECTRFVKVAGRRGDESRSGGGGSGSVESGGVERGSETASSSSSSAAASAVGSGEGAVDSLNVSVAAALLLHDLLDVFGGKEEDEEE